MSVALGVMRVFGSAGFLLNYQAARIITGTTEDITIADALTTFTELVQKRDYESALNHWQSVQHQVDGFAYWQNLGQLHLLRGHYAEARYALEKARHLSLFSSATEQQLELVHEKLNVDVPVTSLNPLDRAPEWFMALGPMKIWWLVLILTFGLMVMLKKIFKQKYRHAWLLGACPVLILVWFQWASVAFVALRPIEVFQGPSKVFATGHALPAGARVLGWRNENWIKVYDSEMNAWWLPQSEVALKAGWLWGFK